MDENTWRLVQIIMWLIGVQTAVITTILGFIWNNLSKRMERMEAKISDIDKRVFAIETMLHMKDCCMLKENKEQKKAR